MENDQLHQDETQIDCLCDELKRNSESLMYIIKQVNSIRDEPDRFKRLTEWHEAKQRVQKKWDTTFAALLDIAGRYEGGHPSRPENYRKLYEIVKFALGYEK